MRLHVIPCITDDAQAQTARAKPGGATELGMFGVKRGYKCMPGKGKQGWEGTGNCVPEARRFG